MLSRFRSLCLIGLTLVLLISLPVLNAQDAAKPVRVILIGWDGAQREHVEQCLGRGELPALQRLIGLGGYRKIDVTGVTDTKAGWAEILTGFGPEVTGVYSNRRFQPIPLGATIFERLEEYYGKERFITAAVIGKDHHVGGYAAAVKRPLTQREIEYLAARKKLRKDNDTDRPGEKQTRPVQRGLQQGEIVKVDGKPYLSISAEPYFHTWQEVDVWQKAVGSNDNVGAQAIALLDQYRDRSFFFFVHFADVDHEGHKFGENSKEYNDALISSDRWTGKILDRLQALGLLEGTLVYVTADHGFDEGMTSHNRAPAVFLVSNDASITRDGTRADIVPTIYRRLGIDPARWAPSLTGRPLN